MQSKLQSIQTGKAYLEKKIQEYESRLSQMKQKKDGQEKRRGTTLAGTQLSFSARVMTDAVWEYWDPDSGAKTFNGKEITLSQPFKPEDMSTTYRKAYPLHPVWVHRREKPDHLGRPVPSFPYTSSYREFFTEYKVGAGQTHLPVGPAPKFTPKLSAQTTSRADFMQPVIGPKAVTRGEHAFKPNPADLGTTTQRADFVEWPVKAPYHRPGELPSTKETKFDGTTTCRNAYKFPADMPPPHITHTNPPHVVPPFGGTTTYRESFEIIELPAANVGSIGLQTASKPYKLGGQGGCFERMIKQGAPAPQACKKTFTTSADEQTEASIVVVCKRDDRDDGLVLGFFPLRGLKKSPVGIPKIEVSLKLLSEKKLQASATYIQGNVTKALTFVAGRSLRSITEKSDIPRTNRH